MAEIKHSLDVCRSVRLSVCAQRRDVVIVMTSLRLQQIVYCL